MDSGTKMVMVCRRWSASDRAMVEHSRKEVVVMRAGRWLKVGYRTFDPKTLKQTKATSGEYVHHLEPIAALNARRAGEGE